MACRAVKIGQHFPRHTGTFFSPISTPAEIVSYNGSIFDSWADDGNLLVDGDSTRSPFQAIGGAVFGDAHSRYLHLYQDTMSALWGGLAAVSELGCYAYS